MLAFAHFHFIASLVMQSAAVHSHEGNEIVVPRLFLLLFGSSYTHEKLKQIWTKLGVTYRNICAPRAGGGFSK